MSPIALFFETNKGKYLKNLIIGLGASVVLLGALFKLQHWPFASQMLTTGMCTEAFIFALLGLLPPHADYYWERFYPDITLNPHVEAYQKGIKHGALPKPGEPATKSLDKMLEEAQINTPNLKKMSENFDKFNKTVNQMKDISDVTLSKNLGTLNQIYEVELSDANNHLKAMNKFYSNLVNASEAMASSAKDATDAKEQMGMLAKNLTTLNQIYGNMLSAMQGR
jgi:hypothetical protein